jgi:serine/threonine protein phosphatase PrpC
VAFEHAIKASQGARSYQEDAAAIRPDGSGLVAVLADGMGGHAGGAVASDVATSSFLEGYLAAEGDARERLAEALGCANAAILGEASTRPGLRGMGCTLVGLAFAADGPDWGIDWISVGDSPLYLVRKGEIVRLNADHSLAPEIDRLAELGHISWAAAHADPNRHVLRSALTGTSIDMIDRPRAPLLLEPGDLIVLASDGIHSIAEAEITRIATASTTPAAAAEALLAAVAAVDDPHQDNTTVVVVRVV